jgi:peroxiredoxin
MIKSLIILVFLTISLNHFAQEYKISGTVNGLDSTDVYLMRLTGDNRSIVDTAMSDYTGSFEFSLDRDFPVGQYAVLPGPGQMVELIFNKEDIRFVASGATADDQVQIIESVENLIYYDYLNVKGMNLYKLDLLYPILEYYPRNDNFYQATLSKVKVLQNEISDRVKTLAEENPSTFTAKLIEVDKPVFANPELSQAQQNQFLKSHYFSETDFQDTLLLNTNILTGKIISYLTLYQDQNMTQEELEENLVIAVDTVLEKAFVNQQVYEFVVSFLIKGFEAIGFEKGLEHIANHNMVNDLCVNSERKKELENKIELIKRLAIGQPAPDFTFTDDLGNSVSLDKINSEKTVIVFWASWCPHCTDILPTLKEYYNPDNTSQLEIIGVSIDTDAESWQNAISDHQFNWINIAELKGWDGPIVEQYGVSATPTFFVLDKNKKIIGKPANEKDLRAVLGN